MCLQIHSQIMPISSVLKPSNGRKRGRPRSKSAPAVLCIDKIVPKRRMRWTDEAMRAAMDLVKSGKYSISRAAKLYDIPNSTLHDRISGKVLHGQKPGRKRYLSAAEENEMANFFVEVAKAGYGKTITQVRNIAGMAAHDKGKVESSMVSYGWFRRFLERHPHLSYRKGDPTANVRMNCLNKQVISDYFDLLKQELTTNQLMHSPNRIYNVDETGMCLDAHAPRVLALKGQKKVRHRTSGNKNQITVIACLSASGQCIPPFVIFDAKRLNLDWRKDEVVGTSYGLSSNGWVDSELFKGWLVQHFVANAVGDCPILLLLDGHSSHFQPDLIQFARQYGIIMFCLPPHTTHESQPLDTSVFKSLKHNWNCACQSFIQSHPSQAITKYHFSGLLNQAWGKTMTSSTISAGFRKCGVYPFNPDAIDCGISVDNIDKPDKDNNDDDEDQQSGDAGSETQHSRATNEKEICEQWPPEKIALFQWRYDEGYDLPDEEYMQWSDKTHPNAGNTIGNNNLLLMDYFSDLPTATPVTVSSQLATEMPHDGPSLDTTMASEEEMDREASSYTLPGEDAEHRISSLEKAVDVPLEEVSDKQPPVELEHKKTLPNKGTFGEITRKTSFPDANHEDTENGGEL